MTHGTIAAWSRHHRDGETPCEECREGYNRYRREKYANNPKVRASAKIANYRRDLATRELIRRHRTEYLELLRGVPEARQKAKRGAA